MVKVIREKTDAGPWLSVVETGGGGELPDWWTVNSTPGSESVDFAGAVTISPTDENDTNLTLVPGGGAYNDAFVVNMSPDGDTGSVFQLTAGGELTVKGGYDGAIVADLYAGAPNTTGTVLRVKGVLGVNVLRIEAEGSLLSGAVIPASTLAASQFSIHLDDDDTTPALVITAKTADGTGAAATILLTPA